MRHNSMYNNNHHQCPTITVLLSHHQWVHLHIASISVLHSHSLTALRRNATNVICRERLAINGGNR